METSPAAPTTPQPGAPRPSSPESLDSIIKTTSPRGWWALWAITGAVVAVLIWSVVATIPQQKSASGVVNDFAYSHDITATTAGIFDGATGAVSTAGSQLRSVTAGDPLGTITPYDGSPPVPVTAPVSGTMTAIYVALGEGVEPGTVLGRMQAEVDAATPLAITAWVPLSTAGMLTEGSEAVATIDDLSTGSTVSVPVTIAGIADTPATLQSMSALIGNPTLAEEWLNAAGGQPYRIDVTLDLSTWPEGTPYPALGAVVTIVATYAEVHPIEILFGGAA